MYEPLAMSKRTRTPTDFYSPHVKPGGGWSKEEQALLEDEPEAYKKEQKRRKLAGQTPIIICMGGPWSDAWYPPL